MLAFCYSESVNKNSDLKKEKFTTIAIRVIHVCSQLKATFY